MNQRSTSHTTNPRENYTYSEPYHTNQTIATLIDNSKSSKAYFDLTGQFPYTLTRGYKYIFLLYNYDSNAILTEPIKSRSASEIKQAWINLHTTLNKKGIFPNTYIMDNKASKDIKQAITKHKLQYQLTLPHIHQINAAERAIRTFKNHFIAGLASVDPKFPINEWHRLLPQAEITLNLLQSSRLNPRLSAYAYLNEKYEFTRHPMAPPVTKVVVHSKPHKRQTWGYHGEDGFYVGPSLEHYRCIFNA